MNNLKLLIISFVLVGLSGCSAPQAKVDFDKNSEIDTRHYQTFSWLNEQKIVSPVAGINRVMQSRVEKAIEETLISKGYQLITDARDVDFTISYSLGNRDKVQLYSYPVTHTNHFHRPGRYPRKRYAPVVMRTETQAVQYNEGKLAIDIYDAKSQQPVWHGWAVKRLTDADKGFSSDAIHALVQQILEPF